MTCCAFGPWSNGRVRWYLDARNKMPVSPVGKNYFVFVFFVLAMHASVNIVYIHEPQTSPIARSS